MESHVQDDRQPCGRAETRLRCCEHCFSVRRLQGVTGQALFQPENFCFVSSTFYSRVPNEILFEKSKWVQMQTCIKPIDSTASSHYSPSHPCSLYIHIISDESIKKWNRQIALGKLKWWLSMLLTAVHKERNTVKARWFNIKIQTCNRNKSASK